MTPTQQLDALRALYRTADAEERHAIQVTANAIKRDDPRHYDVVNRRIAAHHRNQGKPYDVPDESEQMKLWD
jgi:hypothetical protein